MINTQPLMRFGNFQYDTNGNLFPLPHLLTILSAGRQRFTPHRFKVGQQHTGRCRKRSEEAAVTVRYQ
jgi:hypothetical protein